MATDSSILAWKIPRMEEPGGLHSPWGCKESDTTEPLHFQNISGKKYETGPISCLQSGEQGTE